jgi:hypothetical protein
MSIEVMCKYQIDYMRNSGQIRGKSNIMALQCEIFLEREDSNNDTCMLTLFSLITKSTQRPDPSLVVVKFVLIVKNTNRNLPRYS